MINYFVETPFETLVHTKENLYVYNEYEKYITHLCKMFLFDFNTYKKLLKNNLNMKSKVPIKIDNSLFLFKIKDNDDLYYINYSNILNIGYIEELTMILFIGGDFLCLNNSINDIKLQINKIEIINKYLSGLKHIVDSKLTIEYKKYKCYNKDGYFINGGKLIK